MRILKQYKVYSDRETGVRLHEPEYVGEVEESEWNKKNDTNESHFDTYEHFEENDHIGETRAIELIWKD